MTAKRGLDSWTRRVGAFGWALGLGLCQGLGACVGPWDIHGHFGIILPDRVPAAVQSTPRAAATDRPAGGDGSGHGDGAGATANAPAPARPPAAGGGGSGGGGVFVAPPAPNGMTIRTEDRLTVLDVAGTPAAPAGTPGDALSAGFGRIAGIVPAPGGTVYVCDAAHHQIRAVPPGGPTYVAAGAGDGAPGYIGDNLPAIGVRLNTPIGLARDANTGALLVCDSANNRIRYFVDGARIYTLAGGGLDPTDAVTPATNAALAGPYGLALDGSRNVYFTERGSGRVRVCSPAGALTTIATFTPDPAGPIAVDPTGNHLWVGVGDGVFLVTPRGALPATTTSIYRAAGMVVTGLAYDQANTLYVRQTAATPAGLAGTALVALVVDGSGAARGDVLPEVLAGKGGTGGADLDYYVPPVLQPDARTRLLAGADACALAIDLSAASDPATPSGTLYMGNSYADGAGGPTWAELLRLDRP